jgi:tape measure domain-containing protein
MSDIALKASIDFRDAEKQVDTFVKNAKKKMSEIMAAANRPGGSMNAPGGTMGGQRGGQSNIAKVWLDDMDRMHKWRTQRQRDYVKFWNEQLSAQEKFEKTSAQKAAAREKANAKMYSAGTAQLRAEIAERNRIASAGMSKLSQIEASIRKNNAAKRAPTARQDEIEAAYNLRARQEAASKASQIDSMWAAKEMADRKARVTELKRNNEQMKRETSGFFAFVAKERAVNASVLKSFDDAIAASDKAGTRQLREERTERNKIAQETARRQSEIDAAWTAHKAQNASKRKEIVSKEAAWELAEKARTDQKKAQMNAAWAAKESADSTARAAEQKRVNQLTASEIQAFNKATSARAPAREASSPRTVNAGGGMATVRTIGGAENTALGVRNRIGRQLGEDPALQARLIGQLDSALASYSNTVRTYGSRSMEAARASVAWNRELQTIRGTIAEKGGLLRTLNQNTDTLKTSIGGLGSGFSSLNRLLLNTQVVLSSLTAAFGLREVLAAITQYERFSNTLRTVSGSSGEFQRNMSFLFGEANRIGFSVGEVGNAFARLSVAMSGAGFSSDETRRTFTQLAEASRNFGISSADTTGIIRALEQSMSKGKFMAEEVRLQMGDRLPIAMAALQRAMERVDGAAVDVNKRFEEGTIDVRRYALAFVEEINRMSGGAEALQRTSTSLSAAFGRLSTEFLSFSQALGEGGLTNATITVTENLRSLMETARESGALDVLGGTLERIANSMNLLLAAGVALGALFAGRLVQGLISFAAAASPAVRILSVLAGGAVVAFEALDRMTSSTRAANELNSALRDFNTSADQIRGTIGQFNDALARNNAELSASSTAVERRIEALRRLGETEAEATRIAAEEERKRMEIRLASMREDLTRAEAAQAAQNRRAIGREGRAFVDGFTNSQSIANSPRFNNIANDASAHVVTRYNAGVQIITDFTNGVLTAREAVRKLNETFAEGTMPREIDAIRRAINEASMSDPFEQSERAVRNARLEFQRARAEFEDFVKKFSNPINIQITMDLFRREFNDAPNAGANNVNLRALSGAPLTSADVAGVSQPQSLDGALAASITRNPTVAETARNLRSFIADNNLDRTIDGGNRFGADVRGLDDRTLITTLRSNPLFRTLAPGVSSALGGVNINEGGGSGRNLTNAVGEFMDDFRRQARSAGRDDGAVAAHADALNRLEDAARNAGGAIDIANERLEVQLLVTERLNKESEKFIRDTNRSSDANDRLAQAYMQGADAAERAEVRERAMAEARKTAREFGEDGVTVTEEYKARVEELIPVLDRAERSQRALAAARSIATNRDEIEILRAEQRLISANANDREREVAALRARQAARGTGLEDQAGRSAAQVVELRQQNEQLSNSWNEMARVGEQAFDRIGSAITEAFAKGEIKALKFSNIYRAILSEIIQATMRMAIINPILNSVMGGSRPTMSGLFSVSNMSGGSTGLVGGLSGLAGGISGLSGIGSSISSFFGGSGGAASGASAASGISGLAGIGSSISGFFGGSGNAALGSSAFTSGGMGTQQHMGDLGFYAPSPSTLNASIGTAGTPGAMGVPAGAGMGGMLGGMAMGFGMGSMVGGLIAGKSAARQQNAQIGAALGAVALGPIGGLVGGAIGGMIGPKKANTFYNLGVDTDEAGNFRVGSGGGKRADAQLASLRNGTEQAVAELNARMEALGLRASGSANLGSGVTGAKQFEDLNDALNQFKITASDSQVQGAIDRLAAGDTNKAFDVAAQAKEFISALDSVKKELKNADDPIAQIVSQFDSLRESADKLGFGMDEVTTAQEKAIRAYREEQALGPIAGLADYARSLRVANDNSGTPMSRLASAETMFNETAALAASGDVRSLGVLQDRAETFRQLSRDVFGSGVEFALAEQRILDSLANVGQLTPDQLTGDDIRQQTETLVEAIERLREEVKTLRRETQQQASNPLTARAA